MPSSPSLILLLSCVGALATESEFLQGTFDVIHKDNSHTIYKLPDDVRYAAFVPVNGDSVAIIVESCVTCETPEQHVLHFRVHDFVLSQLDLLSPDVDFVSPDALFVNDGQNFVTGVNSRLQVPEGSLTLAYMGMPTVGVESVFPGFANASYDMKDVAYDTASSQLYAWNHAAQQTVTVFNTQGGLTEVDSITDESLWLAGASSLGIDTALGLLFVAGSDERGHWGEGGLIVWELSTGNSERHLVSVNDTRRVVAMKLDRQHRHLYMVFGEDGETSKTLHTIYLYAYGPSLDVTLVSTVDLMMGQYSGMLFYGGYIFLYDALGSIHKVGLDLSVGCMTSGTSETDPTPRACVATFFRGGPLCQEGMVFAADTRENRPMLVAAALVSGDHVLLGAQTTGEVFSVNLGNLCDDDDMTCRCVLATLEGTTDHRLILVLVGGAVLLLAVSVIWCWCCRRKGSGSEHTRLPTDLSKYDANAEP
mmetsp:Transcript_4347/g.4996  ORF Transcript_4347/g.4996 Transcript_4347/m.4996 type:complete len:478 (+) Transcript_4347:42-1475(+)